MYAGSVNLLAGPLIQQGKGQGRAWKAEMSFSTRMTNLEHPQRREQPRIPELLSSDMQARSCSPGPLVQQGKGQGGVRQQALPQQHQAPRSRVCKVVGHLPSRAVRQVEQVAPLPCTPQQALGPCSDDADAWMVRLSRPVDAGKCMVTSSLQGTRGCLKTEREYS